MSEEPIMTPLGIPRHLSNTLSDALSAGDPAALERTLEAALDAATSYQKFAHADAVAAVERFHGAMKDAKTNLMAFRNLGVPALSVSQALAVVEALKLASALVTNAEFDPAFIPTQLLEVLTDTTGFSTVSANMAAKVDGRAMPNLPVWTDSPITTGDAQAVLSTALLTTQHKLSEAIRTASAALVKAEDADELLTALSSASRLQLSAGSQ